MSSSRKQPLTEHARDFLLLDGAITTAADLPILYQTGKKSRAVSMRLQHNPIHHRGLPFPETGSGKDLNEL
ncbi:MAG: hypothetical protein QXH12_08040 [Candidatus Caldarchaeum sp.]